MSEQRLKGIHPGYNIVLTAMLVLITLIYVFSLAIALQATTGIQKGLELMVQHTPNLLYISALWYARAALKQLTTGQAYAQLLPTMLNRTGQLCFVGGAFHVAGQALVLKLLDGALYKSLATYDPASFIIMSLGAILIMLSQICASAAEMKQHLYEIV
ncbi:MAG: hypothetical protein AB8F65_10815 [Woeseiaceae bacterium]